MIDPGTAIGAVHLTIADLRRSIHFYEAHLGLIVHRRDDRTAWLGAGGPDLLVLTLMQRYGPSALFVSAAGYHHHIGLNTWAGVGAPPPPPGAIGLRHFVVRLPTEAGVDEVATRIRAAGISLEPVDGGLLGRDPADNAILLST